MNKPGPKPVFEQALKPNDYIRLSIRTVPSLSKEEQAAIAWWRSLGKDALRRHLVWAYEEHIIRQNEEYQRVSGG